MASQSHFVRIRRAREPAVNSRRDAHYWRSWSPARTVCACSEPEAVEEDPVRNRELHLERADVGLGMQGIRIGAHVAATRTAVVGIRRIELVARIAPLIAQNRHE